MLFSYWSVIRKIFLSAWGEMHCFPSHLPLYIFIQPTWPSLVIKYPFLWTESDRTPSQKHTFNFLPSEGFVFIKQTREKTHFLKKKKMWLLFPVLTAFYWQSFAMSTILGTARLKFPVWSYQLSKWLKTIHNLCYIISEPRMCLRGCDVPITSGCVNSYWVKSGCISNIHISSYSWDQ